MEWKFSYNGGWDHDMDLIYIIRYSYLGAALAVSDTIRPNDGGRQAVG